LVIVVSVLLPLLSVDDVLLVAVWSPSAVALRPVVVELEVIRGALTAGVTVVVSSVVDDECLDDCAMAATVSGEPCRRTCRRAVPCMGIFNAGTMMGP
jgi:hypothetical protein